MAVYLCVPVHPGIGGMTVIRSFLDSKMVDVVQLVRTSDCDSEGRGFEPHHSPHRPRSGAFSFTRTDAYLKNERPSIDEMLSQEFLVMNDYHNCNFLWANFCRSQRQPKCFKNSNFFK